MGSREHRRMDRRWWLGCCAGLVLGAGGCAGTSSSSSAPGSFGDGTGGSSGSGGSGVLADGGSPNGNGGATAPPEQELDSTYQAPISTGRFIWIANPTSGRVAYVDATSLVVKTVEAGDAPTTVAAVPGADEVVVLNALSNDATVLRTDGTTLTSRTIPGIVAGANRLAVSRQGRFAIAWVDGRQVANARSTDGFQTLTVIDLGAGASTAATAAHTTLAVGFRPASVSFSADEGRAFAVTEDGVSIITLGGAGGPLVNANVALDTDPTADADTRDVSITGDGRFALVRREGSNTVGVVDLGSGALTALALSGPVTDLDVTDDGTRAVAVVRDTSEVAVIPLGGVAPTPADVTHLTITGETIGQTALTMGGAIAVLYSNAVSSERITVLTLSASPPTWRTLRVHAPVLSVIPTADGQGAVVLHPADAAGSSTSGGTIADAGTADAGSGDARADAGALSGSGAPPLAGAFSLLPLDGTHPALIQATDAPIQAVAVSPASDRTLITVRDDKQAIFGAYVGQFPTLAVARYPLASPPIAVGVAATANRGYVAQQHPDGRITLIALDSGDARTLTGYELGARVVDWSQP